VSQPVASWAAKPGLGWTCSPAGVPETFWVVTADEQSALTLPGLVMTALRWLHLLPFPRFKMQRQHVSSESILVLN